MSITFYQQQVIKLTRQCYPNELLSQQIIQAKKYMDQNFSDDLTLQQIAGKAFYSSFHFLRLFKNHYGTTPHQYLTCLRIQKAKQLLQQHIPLADICFAIGFKSCSSFKGLFKKHTGCMPNSYKKQFSRQLEN